MKALERLGRACESAGRAGEEEVPVREAAGSIPTEGLWVLCEEGGLLAF